MKEAVKEAILDGKIPYDHDAAWEYILKIAPDFLGNGNNRQ